MIQIQIYDLKPGNQVLVKSEANPTKPKPKSVAGCESAMF